AEHFSEQGKQPVVDGDGFIVHILALVLLLKLSPSVAGNYPVTADFIIKSEAGFNAVVCLVLAGQLELAGIVENFCREQATDNADGLEYILCWACHETCP